MSIDDDARIKESLRVVFEKDCAFDYRVNEARFVVGETRECVVGVLRWIAKFIEDCTEENFGDLVLLINPIIRVSEISPDSVLDLCFKKQFVVDHTETIIFPVGDRESDWYTLFIWNEWYDEIKGEQHEKDPFVERFEALPNQERLRLFKKNLLLIKDSADAKIACKLASFPRLIDWGETTQIARSLDEVDLYDFPGSARGFVETWLEMIDVLTRLEEFEEHA